MKKYAIFMYDNYDPSGGWNDFVKSFETLHEAIKHTITYNGYCDLFDIVDLNKQKMVISGDIMGLKRLVNGETKAGVYRMWMGEENNDPKRKISISFL